MTWVHRLSDVDLDRQTATCASCGPVSVRVKRSRNGGPRPICRIAWQSRKGKKGGSGKGTDGANIGPCELCGIEGPRVFDHCHATSRARGWLCRNCNLGLGYFHDDPSLLRKALAYLSR